MKAYEKNNNYIIEELEDFVLSQILECGQCFNFVKLGEEEYDIMAFGRALHVRQQTDTLVLYNTCEPDYKQIWKKYFDMETDYGKIKKNLLSSDERLSDAINNKGGIRLLNQDFFETLISFIISQNKQIPQIKQVIRNISHNFGNKIIGYNGAIYYSFPDAETLNSISEEELRACKVGFRAPYIKDACLKIACGEIEKDRLDELDFYEARDLLMTIKGVGEKVADCVLLFSLGRREAFPVDVWMKRIMEKLYFDGQETKKETIEKFAMDRFGEYGGYAQQYLFDYARNS